MYNAADAAHATNDAHNDVYGQEDEGKAQERNRKSLAETKNASIPVNAQILYCLYWKRGAISKSIISKCARRSKILQTIAQDAGAQVHARHIQSSK